jgi:RimJ/RimL family protein N-acetyltransferase
MSMSISFSSERLAFRILEVCDVSNQYVHWLNDPEINRFLETRFTPHTKSSCENFVLAMQADAGSYLFGIFNKKTNAHIGNIKIGSINVNHKVGYISFFIGDKNSWGKGYGAESIHSVTQWGFKFLRLRRIESGCYEGNLAALRSFLKIGYTVEGFHRSSFEFEGHRVGCFILSMLDSDPEKKINE